MRYLFPIVAIATLILGAASARASELPSFEVLSFPISLDQVALLGATNVQEQTPAPMLSVADMPASLHQIAVLSPRAERFRPRPSSRLKPVTKFRSSSRRRIRAA